MVIPAWSPSSSSASTLQLQLNCHSHTCATWKWAVQPPVAATALSLVQWTNALALPCTASGSSLAPVPQVGVLHAMALLDGWQATDQLEMQVKGRGVALLLIS